MTITVRMDRKTEKLLNRLTKTKGSNKSEVIREAIRLLADNETNKDIPIYDRIKDLVGTIDTGGRNLSQESHKKVSALIKKRNAGPR